MVGTFLMCDNLCYSPCRIREAGWQDMVDLFLCEVLGSVSQLARQPQLSDAASEEYTSWHPGC
jgi:hypothetical protein